MIRDIYIKGVPSGVAPVGATLMKTGQTTSYRTGDDGDIEAGRDVDFFTLPANNPFGNTDRFTDELGGSTYTNDIVIDWSTYNGSTVLGWYRVVVVVGKTWADAIDFANALSVATFTTGWRVPNVLEIMSIYNFSISSRLNYPPFNFTLTLAGWTSTTNPANGTHAYYSLNDSINPPLASFLKTNNRVQSFSCRTFTVTGTTLT